MLDERGCVRADVLGWQVVEVWSHQTCVFELVVFDGFPWLYVCCCRSSYGFSRVYGSVMLVGVGKRSRHELTLKSQVNHTVNIDLPCGRHGDLKWFGLCFIILESFHTVLKLKHAVQPP